MTPVSAVFRVAACGALLALGIAVGGCGSDDQETTTAPAASAPSDASDGPIVIGSATARSGPFAAYDAGPATGLEVAVDRINDKGGVLGRPLKIVYSDTASDPAKGPTAALDVIEKGADVVVVSCDFDLGAPAASVAIEKGKLASSTCGASKRFNPDVLGPLLFTMSTGTPAEGEIMADWAVKRKRFKTAYVLEDPGFAYSKDLCDGFKATFPGKGGKIVGADTFKSTDVKVSAQIGRIKATKPDFVFLCALTPAGPTVLKQLRAAGVQTPVLSGAAMDGDYWTASVPKLSNFYFDTYGSLFGDDPRPAINAFVKTETAKAGKRPTTSFDLTGYAFGEALKKGIERAKSTDGAALAKALESFRDEPLITGPTTFTAKTHLNGVRPMAIMQVQDGRHSFLEMYPKR